MKVYLVTQEPYHDNSVVVGVYDSEQEAVNAAEAVRDQFDEPCIRVLTLNEVMGFDPYLSEKWSAGLSPGFHWKAT